MIGLALIIICCYTYVSSGSPNQSIATSSWGFCRKLEVLSCFCTPQSHHSSIIMEAAKNSIKHLVLLGYYQVSSCGSRLIYLASTSENFIVTEDIKSMNSIGETTTTTTPGGALHQGGFMVSFCTFKFCTCHLPICSLQHRSHQKGGPVLHLCLTPSIPRIAPWI